MEKTLVDGRSMEPKNWYVEDGYFISESGRKTYGLFGATDKY